MKNPFLDPSQVPEINGILFATAHAGLKKSGDLDLALVTTNSPTATVSGVFTTNKFCAAPVLICRKNLKSNPKIKALVVNAGIANAATGSQGLKNANAIINHVAKLLKLSPKHILPFSTGKIGPQLPVAQMKTHLSKMASQLSSSSIADFAKAIRTTDAYAKASWTTAQHNNEKYSISVVAKGVGMIEPHMATMLCYVFTDAQIPQRLNLSLLKEAVNRSLNRLTVDGDTSTNDPTVLMESGLSKFKITSKKSSAYTHFLDTLTDLLQQICLQITRDGEGATKCLRIFVNKAKSESDATIVAKAIGNSQLVKTAFFGNDPNWGRIICALGYSGVSFNPDNVSLSLQNIVVFSKGKPLPQNEEKARDALKKNTIIDVKLDINTGKASSLVFASDLTYDYIKINAEYST